MTILKRILFVDDSVRDTELALAAFADAHLANPVDTVEDGADALDYVYRRGAFAERPDEHPAFVLLDLKMPKVDGMEVLRQMKSDPLLKVIPVVMMTSSREEQDLIRSYALGVNAFVVKPVNFGAFAEAVKSVGGFWAALNEPPPRLTDVGDAVARAANGS
jgi:CheY-like chemotaxis protein